MSTADQVHTAASWLQTQFAHIPPMAVMLGSGLNDWLEEATIQQRIPYETIPDFPASTVTGHAGELLLTTINKTSCLIFSGRFHLYEGYSPQEVALPIQSVALAGVRRLILTNAAGSLHPRFPAGELMLIADHINQTGHNPLRGKNVDSWGPRFPDMSSIYNAQLRHKAHSTALQCGLRLHEGIYVGICGPSLETPAETRFYRTIGADAIGMSTVTEAIAAHHMGLELLGISCLTNANLPDCMAATSFEEILAQARECSRALGHLLRNLLPVLGADYD